MAPELKFPHNRIYPKAPAPNDDVNDVGGNCTPEQKQWNSNILAYFAGSDKQVVFGQNVFKDMKLMDMSLNKRRIGSANDDTSPEVVEGQQIYELEVTEAMLNQHGVVAGACIVHLIDLASFASLYTAGLATGKDPTGGTIAMEIKWYSAALPGTLLRVISTSINLKGRIVSARAEVYDKKTGTLIATGTHSINPLISFKDTAARRAKL